MPRVAATLQNAPVDKATPEGTNWLRLRNVWEKAARVINGLLSFGDGVETDNVSGAWANVTLPAANTDFTITHNLQRVPAGYVVWAMSAAGSVYTSPTVNPNPDTQIILRSTAVIGTTVRLFVS